MTKALITQNQRLEILSTSVGKDREMLIVHGTLGLVLPSDSSYGVKGCRREVITPIGSFWANHCCNDFSYVDVDLVPEQVKVVFSNGDRFIRAGGQKIEIALGDQPFLTDEELCQNFLVIDLLFGKEMCLPGGITIKPATDTPK